MLLPCRRSQQGSAITRYQRRKSIQTNDMIPSFALSVLRCYAWSSHLGDLGTGLLSEVRNRNWQFIEVFRATTPASAPTTPANLVKMQLASSRVFSTACRPVGTCRAFQPHGMLRIAPASSLVCRAIEEQQQQDESQTQGVHVDLILRTSPAVQPHSQP